MTKNAVRNRYFLNHNIFSYLFPHFEAELDSPNMLTLYTTKMMIRTFASPFILRKTNSVFTVSALRKNLVSSLVNSTDLGFFRFRNFQTSRFSQVFSRVHSSSPISGY